MVKIAVIGCGLMGIKVAGEMAYHGHRIKMYDSDVNSLNSAYERIEADKQQLHKEGLLPYKNFIGQILLMNNIDDAVKDAEFIFEVVSEDLKLKADLFEIISRTCSSSAIIATSTLRLDVSSVAEKAVLCERTLGIRFLYPVYCIPEVEITPSKNTSADVINKVRSLMERMGKTLFFRSGDEPLILSEEQREYRKLVRLEQIKNSSSHCWHLENAVPALSHRGNLNALPEDACLVESEKDCAICMDKQRDCLLCPCHHLVTCSECAKSLIARHDGCPICRKEIIEVIHVYHS